MDFTTGRRRLFALGLFVLAALVSLGLLAGCVAANEPASSNEQDRANDNGEAAKPAEEETFTDETATSTALSRATIPTHMTVSQSGQTVDRRYNIDETSGQVGKIITEVTGTNAYSETVTYTYDEQGTLTGGTAEINGTPRAFTAMAVSKQDGDNVDYDITETYSASPLYDGDNHLIAAVQNVTNAETDYEIDVHGHVVEWTVKTAYTMGGKSYELDEEATFNEDGQILTYESSIEEVNGPDVGDADYVYAYSNDGRSVTKTDKRDDGSDVTTQYDLAYNEIGQLFRVAADGIEGTIEYYETPATETTASTMAILPFELLI